MFSLKYAKLFFKYVKNLKIYVSLPELGTFVLDTYNPNRLFSISTVGTFSLRN